MKKNILTLPVIKAEQPIGNLFITKISFDNLLGMSKVDRRHISNDDEVLGIQRELKADKVKRIQKYLTTINATFPNSIIVNVNSENIESSTEKEISLLVKEDTFTIIDGQHRLAGFEGYKGDAFDIILTIFVDLEIAQQAELFSTINSEQTKVDPSLNVNLVLDDKYFTPRKMMVEIANSFNYDKSSPWFNQIKMLGLKNNGIISLASFVRPLFDLTYPERDWYLIKNELTSSSQFPSFDNFDYDNHRYFFWLFYTRQDIASIYKILLNYFSALKNIFTKDWMSQKSILNKTTGYNAMMRLFKDLIPYGLDKHDFTYQFFFDHLSPLVELDGTITSENYGSSGLYSTNLLYKQFKEKITWNIT